MKNTRTERPTQPEASRKAHREDPKRVAALALADTEAPRHWSTNGAAAWENDRAVLQAAIDADDLDMIEAASAGLTQIRDYESTESLLIPWADYRSRARELPAGDFVVPKLYRRGQSSLLAGEPKAGKSTLCRRIAVEVAKGGRVLGYPVDAAVAVYMPLQEDPQHVVREVETIDPHPDVRLYLHDPGRAMEWDRLTVELLALDAAVLLVDMLADFKIWEDGNDYVEMKRVVGDFTRLARNANCHVLLVHHGNKTPATSYPTARVHGSAAIAGEVDVVASVHRDPKKGRIFQAEGRGIGFFETPIPGGHT